MISFNGSNTGLYLGSTQIGQAYLGSTLVYQHNTGLPANSLLIRFDDTTFTPTAIYGTWTKKGGSQYNDWVWQKNDTNWSNGFAPVYQKYLYPSFSLIDAGDLSAVTSVRSLFAFCEISNDIYDVIEIVMSRVSSSVADCNYMFYGAKFNTFSKWNSRLNIGGSHIFSHCVDWQNPKKIYDWAASSSNRSNIVCLSGTNSSAGFSSLQQIPIAGGGLLGTRRTAVELCFGYAGYYSIYGKDLHLSGQDTSIFGRGVRLPSYFTTPTTSYRGTFYKNYNSSSGKSISRSYFYGHGSHYGQTAVHSSVYSKSFYFSMSFFQIDPQNGNLTWQMNCNHKSNCTISASSNSTTLQNGNSITQSQYTFWSASGVFIPLKPTFLGFLGGPSNETSYKAPTSSVTGSMVHSASDYFILVHGSSTGMWESSAKIVHMGDDGYSACNDHGNGVQLGRS